MLSVKDILQELKASSVLVEAFTPAMKDAFGVGLKKIGDALARISVDAQNAVFKEVPKNKFEFDSERLVFKKLPNLRGYFVALMSDHSWVVGTVDSKSEVALYKRGEEDYVTPNFHRSHIRGTTMERLFINALSKNETFVMQNDMANKKAMRVVSRDFKDPLMVQKKEFDNKKAMVDVKNTPAFKEASKEASKAGYELLAFWTRNDGFNNRRAEFECIPARGAKYASNIRRDYDWLEIKSDMNKPLDIVCQTTAFGELDINEYTEYVEQIKKTFELLKYFNALKIKDLPVLTIIED